MIKPLTSLRFLFAFLVFMSHCNIFYNQEDSFLYHLFYEGYVGVSFFFILSGFILAYTYQKRLQTKEISKKKFYIARFARIYPLHVFTLLLAVLFYTRLEDINFLYIKKLLLNISLLQSFFPSTAFSFNSVSWSLSDEMFFYALFPFIIGLIFYNKRFFVSLFLVGIISILTLSFWIKLPFHLENWLFYINPFFRIVDFAWGILCYNICKSIQSNIHINKMNFTYMEGVSIALALIFYACAFFIPQIFRHSIWYLLPMGLLISVFYFQKGKFSAFLSNKIFVYLGEISFAFYMFHVLVIKSLKRLFGYTNYEINDIYIFLSALICTFIVSALSFKYIEKPANRIIKRLAGYDGNV